MQNTIVNYKDHHVIPYVTVLAHDRYIITINNYINRMPSAINDAVQGKLFYQYKDDILAVKDAYATTVVLDNNLWNSSDDIREFLATFLDMPFTEIKKNVESGEFKLADLK